MSTHHVFTIDEISDLVLREVARRRGGWCQSETADLTFDFSAVPHGKVDDSSAVVARVVVRKP
jgi:hypothetical protein